MVLLIRLIHGAITAFFLGCLGYVYYAAISRRRSRLLAAAMVALAVEGVVVYGNGGECPLGPVHRRVGDDRTFFELFVPPQVARYAVPFLGAVAGFGMLLVVLRSPRPIELDRPDPLSYDSR
jgi:hypothetical protein